jgi:hypothetical protein
VRTVRCWVKTDLFDPAVDDPCVLARTQMRQPMHAAREKVILGFQAGVSDPDVNGVARRGRDLELHRTLSLVLHDHGAASDMITMAHVTHAQTN